MVQPGDTLYKLARRFNTTVQELAEVNQLDNPNLIFVGQRLIIPGVQPMPTATQPPDEPPVEAPVAPAQPSPRAPRDPWPAWLRLSTWRALFRDPKIALAALGVGGLTLIVTLAGLGTTNAGGSGRNRRPPSSRNR